MFLLCVTEKGTRASVPSNEEEEMDFFILMISVPLFLVVVLLLSVFVLARYARPDQSKPAPAEGSASGKTEGEEHVIA